jgi:ubiquinone/menaquinone biosynthesis C-methylase UbiE
MTPANVFDVDENAEEYDRWYDENERAYQAELQAVRQMLPGDGRVLEIGVGTGRFAAPLNVDVGVDPAGEMLEVARQRGVEVREARGEDLPFEDESFDAVLMATVDPFVDDLRAVLREARRVLRREGRLVVAMIDLASPFGQMREESKQEDKFFRCATLHSADEMIGLIQAAGFGHVQTVQTLFDGAGAFEIRNGHGEGAFVVIGGQKKLTVQAS